MEENKEATIELEFNWAGNGLGNVDFEESPVASHPYVARVGSRFRRRQADLQRILFLNAFGSEAGRIPESNEPLTLGNSFEQRIVNRDESDSDSSSDDVSLKI